MCARKPLLSVNDEEIVEFKVIEYMIIEFWQKRNRRIQSCWIHDPSILTESILIEPRIMSDTSTLQPADYSVVYIRAPDKLVVVNAHQPVVDVVRSSFGGQIQSQSSQSRMVTTFKLYGNPFLAKQALFSSSEDSYVIKRLLGVMIRKLQNLGWILLVASDLGQAYTNSGLFFRHVITSQEDSGALATIAPSSRDR